MRLAVMLATTAALISVTSHAQPAPPPGNGPGPAAPPPGGMPAMPTMAATKYATGLRITDGALNAASPKDAALATATATLVEGATITSAKNAFNPILAEGGKTAVSIKRTNIRLSGTGTNDFLGTGAGILARDGAALVLTDSTIETNGPISSALVAAENATVKIYGSKLVANGGPLPADYKPRIGPGMMEPPAPLGLVGTARTLLAMSNSRTYVYNSTIEADGWGALSTDAAGDALYLEANDCVVKVRRAGYGTYADFGANVVVNRSSIDSGGMMGIIAGKARTRYDGVTGTAADNVMMIHSVMAFDITEQATFEIANSNVVARGSALLVKSANANIAIASSKVASAKNVLLEVRKNDDANATKTNGKPVPGVLLTVTNSELEGGIIDTDPDRTTMVVLDHASLTGALKDVTLAIKGGGKWTANGNSVVTAADSATLGAIDATAGVTVQVRGAAASAPRKLPSGGSLVFSG
ncbi:hypothetical protein NJ75_03472 [Novosphingobium subterraneum]|uniref:Uncharacterized protein n=2 Tax=Novosphingobium subterraneum TaxID=48936 RepID=A0A0B9A3D9_9SPHN|nr:hypothetical protein NJ75_03472 [Novosphingobium subterraneum]